MNKKGLWLLLQVLFLVPASLRAQADSLRVMAWNVENLFDCQHDSLKNDFDFLPDGAYRWTTFRYWQKLKDVSCVVMEAGGLRPLDLIGLCEVENDSVLRDLTKRSPLRSVGYEWVMTDSPDERGVDVALLYHPFRFRLLGHESLRVPSEEHGLRPTRDLLHCWGLLPSDDTLHVVVCHFPSRLGGRQGARNRRLAAQTLCALVDRLGEGCRLLVMGDFNASAGDRLFRSLAPLTDIVPQERRPRTGTYRYQGRWSWIDHFLVSSALPCVQPRLFTAPWLQEPDKSGGWHPRRTYLGPRYQGGVSDHVPILLSLPFPQQ